MQDTKYLKEVETTETGWILSTKLENGVTLMIHRDGYAKDDSGKIYHCVTKEEDGELEILGWCPDIDKEVIV